MATEGGAMTASSAPSAERSFDDEALTDEEMVRLGFTKTRGGWIPPPDVRWVRAEGNVRADLNGQGTRRPLLLPTDFAELVRQVEAAGTTSWLIEGLWPGDAYGIIGAEDKAGKTFAGLDLGVSVATGSYWLNRFPCPDPGPVLLFLGEGGERVTVRRIRGILASRGGDEQDLAGMLHVCHRAPRLTDRDEMRRFADLLIEIRPRLVIIDPLYIAAAGAKGSDLYAMGEVLRGPQEAAQEAGAALVVVTHWNKTGTGSGAQRFTGVGPGAWGRVLASASVEARATTDDGASDVLLRWEFAGSEIPERAFRVRRRVWAEDPDDLDSPLRYEVEVTDNRGHIVPGRTRVLDALGPAESGGLTVRDIGDRVASDGRGPGLTKRTIQRALKDLQDDGLADGEGTTGTAGRWWRLGGAT